MSSSLFNVFDSGDEGELSGDKQDGPVEQLSKTQEDTTIISPPKRQHASSEDEQDKISADPHSKHLHSRKQTRLDQVKPILADSFETQAETEFVGANVDADTGTAIAQQKTVRLAHQIRHQVALPPGYNYVPISQHVPPEEPARVYPFTLDPFQQVSVASIERNESVLVSAHTSAGKTVVAEYAIATALKNKQRVIYTSPIKALSNQKYRELLQEFGDVGLMTGDVTINPSASCLVMTTEILRSMMYRGSEIMREVAWVIFDEIHYMRDKSRGFVWEETIILLPHKVRYVFLSATIPNAKQFAEWICNLHNQACHVVYTDFRPTPLQHYVFPAGGDGIFLCVDEKSNFREENFAKAVAMISSGSANRDNRTGKRGNPKDVKGQTDIFKIIKMIWMRNYQPVIVFSFGKRMCESLAIQLAKLDFNDATEREMVATVYKNAIGVLSEDDQQLPQIQHLLPLLQRGVGIHHSGLLPILKEVIEILFQEGLIKVLFATETFSIGLNMPAKTVVFTAVTKFDGTDRRPLSSGEYIQMSGRAGRRGLDDRGIVILMMDQALEPHTAKEMLHGQADPLNSAFHLTYNMILNLMRVEGISPEFILERSFYQFQKNESVPELERRLAEAEAEYQSIVIEGEEEVREYFDVRQQLKQLGAQMRAFLHQPKYAVPFLQAGRLVRLSITCRGDASVSHSIDKAVVDNDNDNDADNYSDDKVLDFGWAVVINHTKRSLSKRQKHGGSEDQQQEQPVDIIDVLVAVAPSPVAAALQNNDSPLALPSSQRPLITDLPKPCSEGQKAEMVLLAVRLHHLDGISSLRIFVPKELKRPESRHQVQRSIQEVQRRFPDGLPKLDPIKDQGIKDSLEFVELVRKIELLESRMKNNSLITSQPAEVLQTRYAEYLAKDNLHQKVRRLRRRVKDVTAILQLDELKYRKRILRRLGYTNQQDVIELKGRVACEISTGDELVLTELIFNGVFNELTVDQTVALLSCCAGDEESPERPRLPEELAGPLKQLQETARRIAKVSMECKLAVDEKEYVDGFKYDLMPVVYAWCRGAKFSEICKMTDIFEGSIIRAMRRLEELLRQMSAAAKQIGNTELDAKFTEGAAKLKRDIVFAASLYL